MASLFKVISSQEGQVPSRLRLKTAASRTETEASCPSSHPAVEASGDACNPMLAPMTPSVVPKRATILTILCRGRPLRPCVTGICSYGRNPIAVRQRGHAISATKLVVMRHHRAKSLLVARRRQVRLPLFRLTCRLVVVPVATLIGLAILKMAAPCRVATRAAETVP